MTPIEWISRDPQSRANMSAVAALVAYLAEPPTPRQGERYETFVSLESRTDIFGLNAGNRLADLQDALAAWADGPDLSAFDAELPKPSRIRTYLDRLRGHPGLDLARPDVAKLIGLLAAGVPGVHGPMLTPAEAAGLMQIGFTGLPDADITEQQMADAQAVAVRELQIRNVVRPAIDAADDTASAAADADPADRAAIRQALLDGFDAAWPEVE